MAKSLRSKWKRKMRAVKRERYGKKELERLKTVLGINNSDVEMKDENLQEIVTVKNAAELKNSDKTSGSENEEADGNQIVEEEPMDDGRSIFNKKTLKDQHGKYPVWLSSRKLKKIVKRNHTIKSKKNKNKKSGKAK